MIPFVLRMLILEVIAMSKDEKKNREKEKEELLHQSARKKRMRLTHRVLH